MAYNALVTGGSSGIGAATCRLLAERGWAVAVNYRSQQGQAEAIVAEIEQAGGKAFAVQADVAVEGEVQHMFATLDREFGSLAGLVNCAGITGKRGRFEGMEVGDLRQVLDANVLGTMMCSLEAIKRMSTRKGGSGGAIVNVSSGLANTGGALAVDPVFLPDPVGRVSGGRVAYATSKGAVNSFSLALAQEVAREGIRVNTVSPGATVTKLADPEMLAQMEQAIPLGRGADPREIAETIVWLMSDSASYVVGAYLRVGGGRLG